ncbi:hypothetical protein LTR53_014728 [Teratosphaeriaceae sp. CCFEE 6253]|nr:hypothetical protein LTR53_014728 [Teratosphaeriaceae sp. CCFEE 6253]
MNSYKSLINHVFLPPELPQSSDGVAFDTLLGVTTESLAAYKLLRTDQEATLEASIRMTSSMRYTHIEEFIDEKKLAELLHDLPRQGGAILLYISSQNAGMIISRFSDLGSDLAVRFEAFELSPRNKAVYQEAGRLHRSFPGSAIDIDFKIFAETGLIDTVAYTLAKMSHQAALGMQPQARKAGTSLDEDRDTTHPGTISEFFMGFLSATGHPAEVNTISKNTREEVLWRDARSPWRRSPVWILLRVALQLNLPRDLYKEFIVFMMSRVIDDSRNQYLSCDLRYAMMAKVARRVFKLPSPCNANVVRQIQNTLQDTTAALEKQWLRLQTRPPLDLSGLAELHFEKDGFTTLPALDTYLTAISARQGGQPVNDFQPKSGLVVFDPRALPCLTSVGVHREYVSQNLHAVELWVAAHVGEWGWTHINDANACGQLLAFLKGYHALAYRHYDGNPEAVSAAVLTVLQIWVALDACALNLCPFMGEYKLRLSLNIAQNLLLPCKDHMRRLLQVEAYVARREGNAGLSSYFDLSSHHQALCASIKAQAAREKEAKIEELARRKSEYARLMSLHQWADCDYYEYVLERADQWMEHDVTEQRHSHSCQKCAYKAQANRLQIGIHEWPLPSATTLRKAVVFELQPPGSFVHWRDSLIFLIVDVLGLILRSLIRERNTTWPRTFISSAGNTRRHLSADLPIVTASEFTVCLANGLDYKYYDSDVGTFVNGFVSTGKAALACTYKLPQGSTALQKFINRLAADHCGQTPNTVIASLSECPDHMSLDEYKKLSSIPCGWHLQWPNLLIQLGFPAIDFKNVETTLVLLQCIYQSGPAGDDVLREGHGFCGHYESAAKLLEELDVALQRIKTNWESSQALSIFINIASRLLSLSSSTTIHTACLTYLREGRAIAFGWMHDLEEKAQHIRAHKERNEYMSKRAEIALICVDSFNVDDVPLAGILSSSEQASILLQCGIVVQESRLLLGASKEPTVMLLLLRSQRLIHRCYRTLASDGAAIDAGILRSWTGFQPGSPWTATGSDHWITTSTGTELAGVILQVHFNILTGELLVNGLPLDRLPRHYEDHGSYRTLFGNSTIEVMPTVIPGMDFGAKRKYSGHKLHFGWSARTDTATSDLLVQAYQSDKGYELIPSRLFSGIFPAAFVQDHVHWYNLDENMVEFRPIDQLWDDLCPRIWTLVHDPGTTKWRLTRDATSQILPSLTSATSMALSRLLLPMANATSIHIISKPSSHLDSQAQQARSRFIQREVEVEIPGLQLSFALKANEPDLRSKEFPSMGFDPDQSLGTLVGLQSRLLLRHRYDGTRLLLILDGDVTCDRDERQRVAVTIQKAVPGVSSTFHTVRVDALLGRLIGTGDLQSKLFLIHLHALTTHCLPDPLTHKTGTEQALSMLRSASVRSFDHLTEENVKLLGEIGALTPVRQYYPQNERDMQTVGWSSKLGFLAQHAGFRTGVEIILDQARRANIFYPGSPLQLPDLPRSDVGLMHRDTIRYAMFRVSGLGAEEFTIARDTPYKARDQHQASERLSNTYIMSAFVYQHKQNLHWDMPSDVAVSLWEALADASPILDTLTSHPELQYDATLLEMSYSSSVFPAWLQLHRRLCAGTNKYALMMWLSTLACSITKPVNTTVLQTLALSFTRLDMSRVLLPAVRDSFHLAKGKTVRKDELLTAVTSMLDFAGSAESRMMRQLNEKKNLYEKRRKQAFRNATTPILEAVIDRLVTQWPCEVPTAANLSSVHRISVYLDVDKVIHKISPKFKAWYDNLQFFHYLERVGSIMSTHVSTATELSKSSLIVPIVAADLANGSQLVRVVVAKPQSKQMAQMMISKLGGLLDRRVYFMPFSRALKLDRAAAVAIDAMLQECKSNGGILLVQPEHILSFKLMALEMGILGEEGTSKSLLRSQDFFERFSRDLVDESDENFRINFELIYTIGSQRPVEMSPGCWMCIHEILGLIRRFSQLTANELPGSVELTHCLPGRFPRTRILKADAQEHLFLTVALHICTYGLNGFPIARQSQAVRDAVFKYIVTFDLTLEEVQRVEHTGPESFWAESTKEMLLLLREALEGQLRARLISNPGYKLAVPYRAKDNPSPRSEFSHPDVIIMLTTLSYYYEGLSKDDLATAFDHLTRSDQADTFFQAWAKDAHDMPAAFCQLQGINLRDKHQFAVELLPRLRFGKATIDYFLKNIVFPKEMKEFPHKLSASGWDIGKCKALPTTGFSGTNDSGEVLPLFVEQIDLPTQKHTNALVLDYLLRDENSVAEIPAPTTVEVFTSDAERFLNMASCIIPQHRQTHISPAMPP